MTQAILPSNTYQLLLDAEHADWLVQAHLNYDSEMYDVRWHMRQAMAHQAWDRYYDALRAEEQGALCQTP